MKEPGSPLNHHTQAYASSSHPPPYLVPGHHSEPQGLWREVGQRLELSHCGLQPPVLFSPQDLCAPLHPHPAPNSSQGHEKGLEVWKILPKTTALTIGVAEAAQ